MILISRRQIIVTGSKSNYGRSNILQHIRIPHMKDSVSQKYTCARVCIRMCVRENCLHVIDCPNFDEIL